MVDGSELKGTEVTSAP